MGDFRTSAWQLRDALAGDGALAELEQRPISAANARTLEKFRVAADPKATRKVGAELLDAGFRYVGTAREWIEGSLYKPTTDTFIDADDTTYVVVRRSRPLIPLSRFYIVTYLEDGSCIETVSTTKPELLSEPRVLIRNGPADLARAVAEHLAYVRERALAGAKILPVRTLDDVVRLKKLHVSHVITEASAQMYLDVPDNERMMLKAAGGVLLLLLGFVYLLLRR